MIGVEQVTKAHARAIMSALWPMGLDAGQVAEIAAYLQASSSGGTNSRCLNKRIRRVLCCDDEFAELVQLRLRENGIVRRNSKGKLRLDEVYCLNRSGRSNGTRVSCTQSGFADLKPNCKLASTPATAPNDVPPAPGPKGDAPKNNAADAALRLAVDKACSDALEAWGSIPSRRRVNRSYVTPRELSYEIWGFEKALIAPNGIEKGRVISMADHAKTLKDTGAVLGTFAPEWLARGDGAVLLVENLDPYLVLTEVLSQTRSSVLFGRRIAAVIYRTACGTRPEKVFSWIEAMMGHRQVLYWGDIDRAGIHELAMYQSCCCDHDVEVEPFAEFYTLMCRKQRRYARAGVHPRPVSESQPLTPDDVAVLNRLPPATRREALLVLYQCTLIPQEVLTFADYMTATGVGTSLRWLFLKGFDEARAWRGAAE